MKQTVIRFVVDRAKERSTWVGLIGFLSAAGVALSPDQAEAIVTLGIAVAGVVGMMSKD